MQPFQKENPVDYCRQDFRFYFFPLSVRNFRHVLNMNRPLSEKPFNFTTKFVLFYEEFQNTRKATRMV